MLIFMIMNLLLLSISLTKVLLDYSYLIIIGTLASDYNNSFHDYYPCHKAMPDYCLILLLSL